jgi:hypothetical protein
MVAFLAAVFGVIITGLLRSHPAAVVGTAELIRREHVAPRGGVTVLAQLTAASFGTGWAYYAASIAVTLVLALAANTSFGGLPVLMSLELGQLPRRPRSANSLVIVPVSDISKLTEHALSAALALGDDVIAVSVHPEAAQSAAFRAEWDRWDPGVRLDTLDSPHRSLVHPVVDYVRQAQQVGRQVAVLIPEAQPRRWRYRILQNQRGLLLATVLRASTDVVICTIPHRLTTR